MTLRLRASALLVAFEGPLSRDDDVRFAVSAAMCVERGATLHRRDFDRLAAGGDEAVFGSTLGSSVDVDALAEERVWRQGVAVAAGATVGDAARHAVLFAAAWVPVVVLASGRRSEVMPILNAALLDRAVVGVVCADDVAHCRPDVEAYESGLALAAVDPHRTVAVEATAAGADAARGAGVGDAVVATAALTPSSVAALLLG